MKSWVHPLQGRDTKGPWANNNLRLLNQAEPDCIDPESATRIHRQPVRQPRSSMGPSEIGERALDA